MKEFSKIKMLFLAKCAPKEGASPPEFHPTRGVVPQYHYEIYTVLKNLGFHLTSSDEISYLFNAKRKFDYVFSLYNRAPFRNSEVFVSSICEYLKIPYLGSPPHIRCIAEDKKLTKIVAQHLGIPASPGKVYRCCDKEITPPEFCGPYFVKPRFEAASKHIDDNSITQSWGETKERIMFLLEQNLDVLLEQFISGANVTLPIISLDSPKVFPCTNEISGVRGNIVTFRQNRLFEKNLKREIMADSELTSQIQNYGLKFYNYIQPVDYARFDFRVEANTNQPYLLECNICCNLGKHSTVSMGAKYLGMNQEELIRTILINSFKRQNVFRQ